jgi:diguanylate cyclase (GGDEF)-like protein
MSDLFGLLGFEEFLERHTVEGRWVLSGALPFSLIALDFDNLADLNALYGNGTGDLALRKLAASIRDSIDSTDRACRADGDGFFVIGFGMAAAEAVDLADEIRARFAKSTIVSGRGDRVGGFTASAGVADVANLPRLPREASSNGEAPKRVGDDDQLVSCCLLALDMAKRGGKDRVVVFET